MRLEPRQSAYANTVQSSHLNDNCTEFTDARLDEIADQLGSISSQSNWLRTLGIGELVLTHFFGGCIEEWRSHRRCKDESIRRLARRPSCPVGKSALSEAVAIYVACRDLPATINALSPSHVATVLGLNATQRQQFLEHAIAERLTVKELRTEVMAFRKSEGERRGRPRFSPAQAAISQVRRGVEVLELAGELLMTAPDIDPEAVGQLERALRAVESKVTFMRARAGVLAHAGAASDVCNTAESLPLVARFQERRLTAV